MKSKPSPKIDIGNKLVLTGLHLWLTEAMKNTLTAKAERLFRHESQIVRVRISIDCEHLRTGKEFVASGQIEIHGPDLIATVKSDDAYKAMDELIQKLDRMLRRRSTARLSRRTADDIRSHGAAAEA